MRKEVIADDGRSMPGDDKVVACGGEISTGRAPIYQPRSPAVSPSSIGLADNHRLPTKVRDTSKIL